MTIDRTPAAASRLDRSQLERWLFGRSRGRRRTQDSPVMPDVWFAYALPSHLADPSPEPPPLLESDAPPEQGPAPAVTGERVDLLMRPFENVSAGSLASAIAARVGDVVGVALAHNDVYVVASLTFEEMLRHVLPLTQWWQSYLLSHEVPFAEFVDGRRDEFVEALRDPRASVPGRRQIHKDELPGELVWLVGIVGRIAWEGRADGARELPTAEEILFAANDAFGSIRLGPQPEGTLLWSISRNRTVRTAVWLSRDAVKVDAATTLFGLSCRNICWGVIDSGIDARHPAFALRESGKPLEDVSDEARLAATRVVATYDFSRVRETLMRATVPSEPESGAGTLRLDDPGAANVAASEQAVRRGRAVNWDTISEELRILYDSYTPPEDEHGTHVAGILGGDWRAGDEPSPGRFDIRGMCPDIQLYDLRVFGADGSGDEFSILSAMQFVRHLNANSERPVIHGVNLSFAVRHEVAKYAAGRTPVCDEADRLVAAGVVVVAAAGNDGRGGYAAMNDRVVQGYRTVSIADPGNAEEVITVGATHRNRPHTYGVSYFSSRGPTGDGRCKPDLVAPGEKITAPVPDQGLRALDGTSQAAPHVSGAAALLLARYSELIGQPRRIKRILCESCTDLGRDRNFQGAGMLDILRALQSV